MKYIIENDKILEVKVTSTIDYRCVCVDEYDEEHVVSTYDVYDSYEAANNALKDIVCDD